MSRGRIAYASEESLLLTLDGDLLLAFDATTLAPKWTLAFESALAAVVFASSAALPRVHAGNPWRSPASGSSLLVVDRRGGIHAVDTTGRIVGSHDPVGAPVAVAASSSSDGFAIALADRVLVWHAGTPHEVPFRATALAFSSDALVLAMGNARGEMREVTAATRAMSEPRRVHAAITAIMERRAGDWVVATEAAVHHVDGERIRRLGDGGAIELACDASGSVLALQQTADRVVVCDWPTTRVTRIEMAGRTISDVTLAGDRLALALHGGDANIVRLGPRTHRATKEHPGRTSREWTLRVEAEHDVSPPSRFGLGALLTLVVILICVGYLSSSAKQNWVPPPPFLVTETCDITCEYSRVAALNRSCARDTMVDCAADATDAANAFDRGACDDVRAALARVRNRLGARDDGGHARLSAELAAAENGLSGNCAK